MSQLFSSSVEKAVCINIQDKAPAPLGAYSHAVKAGPFVFVCGLGARDPEAGGEIGVVMAENGVVERYDITAQTHRVIKNLEIVLAEAGCTLRDVVDVTVFLAHMEDFAEYNKVYGQYFNFENPPARTTVQAVPPGKNFIEIKAIAYKP